MTSSPDIDRRVRLAREGDIPLLPAVERSAGALFRSLPDLAWIADHDVTPVQEHLAALQMGCLWVAVGGDDRPMGFLSAELGGGVLHIAELAVTRAEQGRGLGRALMVTAIAAARAAACASVTLTTFGDVAWNGQFYARLGFQRLEGAAIGTRLAAKLQAEADRGLPRERRCAMRLDVTGAGA